MSELLTNFKDDILAESMEGKRRYQMITNEDGTVSFIDVTEYEQVGSEFGQAEINAIHREINSKFDSGDVVDPLVVDETGFAADAKLTGDALREVSANYVMLLDRVAAIETIQGNYATSQNGTYRSNAAIYGRDSADFLITFPKPFKKTPSVVNVSGSYVYNDGKTYNTTWALSVKSKTAASFVLTVNNLNGGGISSITINWSATE